MNIRKRRPAAGFTLVEMLVVIAIIGILAGLISVAAMAAMDRAKQVRIKSEVDQLDMALKAFKQQYGAYPPCDLRISGTAPNQNALMAFIIQAFPRYSLRYPSSSPTLQGTIQQDLTNAGIDTANFRPEAALVFWLQGFNPDVTQPFTGVSTSGVAGGAFGPTINISPTPLFNFDQTRLKLVTPASGHPCFVYVPINQTSPYVYFDPNVYGQFATGTNPTQGNGAYSAGSSGGPNPSQFAVTNTDSSSGGIATPYALDVNANGTLAAPPDTFCNPTTFQIISAGQDNQFGAFAATAFRLYPTGTGYDPSGAEDDNVTNFMTSSSLADAKPN